MRLLLTRPEPQSARAAAALAALGHEVIRAPVLAIEPLADAAVGTGPWDAILMTSANAARALAQHRRFSEFAAIPLFTVGRRTADAAKAAGFLRVASADGAEADLVAMIEKKFVGRRGRFLYLAAAEQARDLAGDLRERGHEVETSLLYRAVQAASLPQEARAALAGGRIDGVLHYSQRSAEAFLVLAKAAGLAQPAFGLTHFCLSQQVALSLLAAGARAVRVAERPDERSLFRLLQG